jgi:integrin beta 2
VTKIECNYLFDICQVSDPPPLKSSCTPDWTGERCETRATACEDRCQKEVRASKQQVERLIRVLLVSPASFVKIVHQNCLHGAFCRAIEKETKNKEKKNRDNNSENDKE